MSRQAQERSYYVIEGVIAVASKILGKRLVVLANHVRRHKVKSIEKR